MMVTLERLGTASDAISTFNDRNRLDSIISRLKRELKGAFITMNDVDLGIPPQKIVLFNSQLIRPDYMINPVIVGYGPKNVVAYERNAHLSDIKAIVPRYNTIDVQYTTIEGVSHVLSYDKLAALTIQRALDTMNGKMPEVMNIYRVDPLIDQ